MDPMSMMMMVSVPRLPVPSPRSRPFLPVELPLHGSQSDLVKSYSPLLPVMAYRKNRTKADIRNFSLESAAAAYYASLYGHAYDAQGGGMGGMGGMGYGVPRYGGGGMMGGLGGPMGINNLPGNQVLLYGRGMPYGVSSEGLGRLMLILKGAY
ncbi:hypothetical protein P7C73_g2813, partial [Tremellales sp. Uapishka_1]